MTTVAVYPIAQATLARSVERRGWRQRAAFTLFVLTNVALFMRPVEMLAPSQRVPIYEVLIVTCLALALPEFIDQLGAHSIIATPITACVLGLLVAAVLSHLSHFYVGGAISSGAAIARLAVYYLLVMALVDSPDRLVRLVRWLGWLALALATLALLGYHGLIQNDAVSPLGQTFTDAWGDEFVVRRLRGPGIFHDPNDLCLILVPGLAIWLWMGRLGGRLLRVMSVAAVGVLGYALLLTGSRGGFIVLLAGVMAFLLAHRGWRRMLPWACIVMPILFMLFAGRQTSINLSDREDTAQSRIQIWSDGLLLFRQAPLFGIGHQNYSEEVGMAAHNSFVHCYTELGFFGGSLFFGAFYLALHGLYHLSAPPARIADVRLRRLGPCLMTMLAAYAAGMLSLSRAYIAPTYLMLGLTAAYLRLAAPGSVPVLHLDGRLARRLVIASVLFLLATYIFVRATVRFS